MEPPFPRPTKLEVEAIEGIMKPWEWITSPSFSGLENIPDKGPVLFVGNHTLIGILDVPLMWFKLYHEKGIVLRSLGDHFHFKVPLWREFLGKFGLVDGTPENAQDLMEAGEYLLVFPGGARESFKHKGEKYQLIWKHRLGFAKAAIRHNCTIIPFASVGAEDCFDIVSDGDDMLRSPLGNMLKRFNVRSDLLMPIVKGIGITPLPRPQRFYFHFCEPITVEQYNGDYENKDNAIDLRNKTKASVEKAIDLLIEKRKKDPKKNLIPRILGRLKRRR